jgi:Secretion system C-terminal sorting domain
MKIIFYLLCSLLVLCCAQQIKGQSPGLIVRPVGGNGVTALNPNGDGYSSATTAGFTTDDIAQSEVLFKVVPAAVTEPTGDLSTGPTGGFTDIVTRVDGSGFYLYKDATNIYFRLRIGGIINGSKGYSVLIDTDGRIGGSGPSADPNYVAPAGTSPGNPGFEYEVVFQSNFQVAVYNIDGSATPGVPATFSVATNSQISVALSTDSNTPDYFYDWFVPLTAIGSPSSIRTAVTTVTSPNSALQGSRSDIYGINDANYANTSGAWQTVVNAQPAINLTSFTGVSSTCTLAPVLTSPIATGLSISVSGTWSRLDASKPSSAMITLYKNGGSVGTTTVSTGGTWSIIVATIANGDVFYANAQSAGESQCLQSNNVTASACITLPASPVLTCGSLKGISGTMPSTASGNSVLVYLVPTTNAAPNSNLVSTGVNLTYPTTTNFAFYTNGCSGGANNVVSGVYMIVTKNGSCFSSAVFVCISSGSSGTPPPLSTNALTIAQPVYPSATSISGTGAATGDILRLFINGQYQITITATGSNFSFSGLVLNAGDQIQVYSQTGTACMTQSNVFTVSCFTQPPVITTNATGNLLNGATSITGTSAYPGATVQLYKGTAPSGVAIGSPVIVNSSGVWSVATSALVSGDSYYAVQTVSGCASSASSAATVLTPAACPTITGSYTDASTLVSGTMASAFTGTVRLYQDGALIGSQSISSATSWSIVVSAGTLYYNSSLSATAQATGGAESTGCTNTSVGCTSPATPAISPTSSTITSGNSVTYTVNNVTAGSWYAILDNSGTSYATSSYRPSTGSFSMATNSFTTPATYTLKLSADALTGCPASFATATVTVNAALPLFLINFNGTYDNGYTKFIWSTTAEENVSYFNLEESKDGSSFLPVERFPVQTTPALVHQYHFKQNKQLLNATYYRLSVVDKDGSVQYSQVILVKPVNTQKPLVKIMPNPFNEVLNIHYTTQKRDELTLVVTNITGHVLRKVQKEVVAGENNIAIENAGQLPPGIYFLRIFNKDNTEKTFQKLQKQAK